MSHPNVYINEFHSQVGVFVHTFSLPVKSHITSWSGNKKLWRICGWTCVLLPCKLGWELPNYQQIKENDIYCPKHIIS